MHCIIMYKDEPIIEALQEITVVKISVTVLYCCHTRIK